MLRGVQSLGEAGAVAYKLLVAGFQLVNSLVVTTAFLNEMLAFPDLASAGFVLQLRRQLGDEVGQLIAA
ncbi:hypothetical protein D9M70_497190 [compost metagenome]